jgi:hypothetical protein
MIVMARRLNSEASDHSKPSERHFSHHLNWQATKRKSSKEENDDR